MARKTATIVIEEKNRDAGTRFVVTEMSAANGSRFAFQIFQLLAASGLDINLKGLGTAEVIRLIMGAINALHPDQFDQYKAQLMECVQWQSPTDHKTTRKLMDGDVEEISTVYRLMFEALRLTLGDFFTEISQLLPKMSI